MAASRSIEVRFPDETHEWLRVTAEARGTSPSAVIRDAVALERWVAAERAAGARVYVETRGRRREIRKRPYAVPLRKGAPA